MNSQPERKPTYTCPGESHPISHAVHLARLSSFYHACKECPHREETGSLSYKLVEQVQQSFERSQPETLIRDHALRGVYLNEFDAENVARFAKSISEWFWRKQPFVMQPAPLQNSFEASLASAAEIASISRPIPPTIVVGCDDQPHSPVLKKWISQTLTQNGCQLVETGSLARPCFSFAVQQLNASGGLYITGAGGGPEWTGIDILGEQAIPLTHSELIEIEAGTQRTLVRTSRSSGTVRIHQSEVAYEANLSKHFHAVRPLRICCGVSNRRMASLLERVFLDLSCPLEMIEISIRKREWRLPQETENQKVSRAIYESGADLGILIHDDGQLCQFFNEIGQLIASDVLARKLILQQFELRPESRILVEEAVLSPEVVQVCQMGRKEQLLTTPIDGTVPSKMQNGTFEMGIEKCGRIWFRDTFPQSDAIVTLSKVLQFLSQSDRKFSDVLREQ